MLQEIDNIQPEVMKNKNPMWNEENKQKQYKKMLHRRKIEKIHGHGRIETRKYTLVSARDPLMFEIRWPWLKGIGKLEVTRTTNNVVEKSTRYFLTSLEYVYGRPQAVKEFFSFKIIMIKTSHSLSSN